MGKTPGVLLVLAAGVLLVLAIGLGAMFIGVFLMIVSPSAAVTFS